VLASDLIARRPGFYRFPDYAMPGPNRFRRFGVPRKPIQRRELVDAVQKVMGRAL
jgi:hypothetical protein